VRTRIATDLHDDIGSSLSQIAILSEVVRQRVGGDEAAVREPLSLITGASSELMDTMSDIVWAIDPRKDHLSDLTQRMRRFSSDVFTARQITFEFHAPEVTRDIELGADVRRQVFLIFKESVNNVVRHSNCTRAAVAFSASRERITLRIADNGSGFDTARQWDGHGLSSMRKRTQELGGTLEVVSNDVGGTLVTLHVAGRGRRLT
jgi:signal transduction histidine kinase